MKVEVTIKPEHIIEAAIRRFSHFGINKTSLTEIADDLSISKPLLFYYFQDKNSLIAAVAARIINEFLAALEEVLATAESVEAGLNGLVEVKRGHFKKYYLLALQGDTVDLQKGAGEMSVLYEQGRAKIIALIAALLQKGIDRKLIRPVDPGKTSGLLLDTLSAFEYCLKRKPAIPGAEDIEEVFDKQTEVLHLFLNGLKQPAWKN
jgi:TetR/AcrR family transcriptional repressor of mexJK operon